MPALHSNIVNILGMSNSLVINAIIDLEENHFTTLGLITQRLPVVITVS